MISSHVETNLAATGRAWKGRAPQRGTLGLAARLVSAAALLASLFSVTCAAHLSRLGVALLFSPVLPLLIPANRTSATQRRGDMSTLSARTATLTWNAPIDTRSSALRPEVLLVAMLLLLQQRLVCLATVALLLLLLRSGGHKKAERERTPRAPGSQPTEQQVPGQRDRRTLPVPSAAANFSRSQGIM